MISLALAIPNSRASADASDAAAPAPGGEGAKSAFSAVLQSLDRQPTAEEAKLAITTEEPALAVANDVRLPVPAKAGKNLPDVAAALADLPSERSERADDSVEADADLAAGSGSDIALLPQLPIATPLPQAPVAEQGAAARQAGSAHATPALSALPLPAAPAQLKPEGGEAGAALNQDAAQAGAKPVPAVGQAIAELSLPSAALLAPAKTESGQKAEASSVVIHVAPEAAARVPSGRRGVAADAEVPSAKARESAIEGLLTTKAASAEPASQSPAAPFAQALHSESAQAGRPVDAARPALHSDALQDLTRVVERLAAAREAFAPTAAALAVTHEEFGEISLSFDQQRDGQIAVRLAASDPDAHRAVAAAVGERSAAAATTDSHTGGSQPQAQSRGAATERDANGGNSAQRHSERQDQAQQRRPAANNGQPGNGDTARAGIFA